MTLTSRLSIVCSVALLAAAPVAAEELLPDPQAWMTSVSERLSLQTQQVTDAIAWRAFARLEHGLQAAYWGDSGREPGLELSGRSGARARGSRRTVPDQAPPDLRQEAVGG